jgi:hypothetical protein
MVGAATPDCGTSYIEFINFIVPALRAVCGAGGFNLEGNLIVAVARRNQHVDIGNVAADNGCVETAY